MKHIMLSLDFSDLSSELLRYGMQFAKAFEAKLWLVHVAAPDPDFVGYDVGPKYIREFRADELHDEHRKMQEYASTIADAGIESDALLIQGPTASTIVQEAERLNADLIIMGQHNRRGLAAAFVGSVSAAVTKQSKRPVLLVPAAAPESA